MFAHETHPASFLRIRKEYEKAFESCIHAMAKKGAVGIHVELTLEMEEPRFRNEND
jgi:hypothetical protein